MVTSPFFPNLSRTSWKYKNGGRVTALFVIGYFFVFTKDDSLRVTKVEKNLIAKNTKSPGADLNVGLSNKISGNYYFHPGYSLCLTLSLLVHTSKPYHMLLLLPRTQSPISTSAQLS